MAQGTSPTQALRCLALSPARTFLMEWVTSLGERSNALSSAWGQQCPPPSCPNAQGQRGSCFVPLWTQLCASVSHKGLQQAASYRS